VDRDATPEPRGADEWSVDVTTVLGADASTEELAGASAAVGGR
jgi:hypothetical protein